jgi:hypothetical protein
MSRNGAEPVSPAGPAPHAAFLAGALERLRQDARLVGVAAGGSFATGSLDEFSDLDLVVAVEPAALEAVMAQRASIAQSLGPLLAAFTGEHVGEPRLLICLYGPPPLHVDLKFVALADAAARVEDPVVLWERDGRMTAALRVRVAAYPEPDPQWIEDRFWVWVHYLASKIGRGELFEAIDGLSFLRARVLGPLALRSRGAQPSGVRRIETLAPDLVPDLAATVPMHDPTSCVHALRASIALYRTLRAGAAPGQQRSAAEATALRYVDEVETRRGDREA